MASWQESLSIASSTLVIGTVAYFGAPNAAPWSTLLGGAAAATGANAVWAKKRQQDLQARETVPPTVQRHEDVPRPDVITPSSPSLDVQAIPVDPSLNESARLDESPRLDHAVEEELVHNESEESILETESSAIPDTEHFAFSDNAENQPSPKTHDSEVLEVESSKSALEAIAPSEVEPEKPTPPQPEVVEDSHLDHDEDSEAAHPVVAKLQTLEIEVKDYGEPRPSDVLFDQSALMLGDRYPELSRCFMAFANRYRYFDGLVQKFDQGIFDKEPSNVFFCRFTSTDDNHYRALCHDFFALLKKNTLIRDVRWSYKDKDLLIVSFQKNRDASVLQFINGFWLERYVYQKIKQVLVKSEQDFNYLRNVKIRSPETGKYNELDLVFLVDSELLWCECTTGRQYSKNVEKYSDHLQKLLKLDAKRTLLVLLDHVIDEETALGISDKWGITVTNEAKIEATLKAAL